MNSEILLKNVFVGYNDGKKEALYRSDFERFFYNYEDIYSELNSKEKFIVLGRKGSGKTILAEYFRKKSVDEPCHFCDIRSYKDFKFHELVQLKSNDISPNEYISIWEWVILLDFARMTLQDNGIRDNKLKDKLDKFFKDNHYSISIDSQKIIEITKSNKIQGEAFHIGGELAESKKYSASSYLNYLEDLKETVLGLLKNSSSSYTIFYDELDDRFRDESTYKNSIISLLKAADTINLKLLEFGSTSKVCILLRTDIFSILNDPDLNKLKSDNSIHIDWGNKVDLNSPLIHLILFKIRNSVPDLKDISDTELYPMFFPHDIKGIHPSRFLLERTFFRPRDVITYLGLIIDKYPDTKYFGWKSFLDLKKSYSAYFYEEVRNELSGHLDDSAINQGTILLKQFNRHHFSYKEIVDYFCKNHPQYKEVDLDKILRVFFKFSIIGNKWYNTFKRKDYHSWAYRDSKAEIDFSKDFVIHLGFREELSM